MRIELKPGQKFGRWTILDKSLFKNKKIFWKCRCECGVQRFVQSYHLRTGESRSCGCLSSDVSTQMWTKHGLSKQPGIYVAWRAMIQRCESPGKDKYKYYAGRGIKVCKRWRKSFEAFLEDMGNKPSPDLSLDRINNDGDYEPGNCRWATRSQQIQNSRKVKH